MIILIVDDHEAMLECLRASFEARGHQVLAAGTAAAARDIIDHVEIDAAVIDGFLPGHAGDSLGPYGPELVRLAEERGIRAVLHSGDDEMCRSAELRGYHVVPKGPESLGLAEALAATP